MAEFRHATAEQLRLMVEGMGVVLNGQPADTSGMYGLTADKYAPMVNHMSRMLDANGGQGARGPRAGDPFAEPEAPKGAKDRLRDIGTKIQQSQALSPAEHMAMESALFMGGYDISLDGIFGADDAAHFESFFNNYLNVGNASIATLREGNTNAAIATEEQTLARQQQAAADAARLEQEQIAATREQTSLNAQAESILYYNGGLSADQLGDPTARAFGMRDVYVDNQHDVLINEDYQSVTAALQASVRNEDGFPVTEKGVGLISKYMDDSMLSSKFREDLESGDANSIARAQAYMVSKGADIEIDGKMTEATYNAASDMLRAPQEAPASLFYDDGGLNWGQMERMATSGRLTLPQTPEELQKYLPEEYEMALAIPEGPHRDLFVADTLLSVDPERYNAFVADLNAANADVTLDAAIELAVVETEITNNPLEIAASGTGGDALVYGTQLSNDAAAKTADGMAVFETTDASLYSFMDYLRAHTPTNLVDKTQKISMEDALNAHFYATQTVDAAHLLPQQMAGMGGTSIMPTMGEARDLELIVRGVAERGSDFNFLNPGNIDSLMKDANGKDITELGRGANFNLADPGDINMLMNALSARAQKDSLDMQYGGNIVTAYLNDPAYKDAIDSTIRVANNNGHMPDSQMTNVRVAEETSPAAPAAAEAATPLAQSQINLEDADVAEFYKDEMSPQEQLMNQIKAGNMSAASIIPTPSMLSKPDALCGAFSACATDIITDKPPAGMDIENPANANMSQINPDLNIGNDAPRQSQMNPNLNLGF